MITNQSGRLRLLSYFLGMNATFPIVEMCIKPGWFSAGNLFLEFPVWGRLFIQTVVQVG